MKPMTKLLTLLLPLSLLLSARAFAVSLGDELILSRLGDPVEIEIEVLQWEDMDLERVEISAASQAEYDVFNLTWLPVLEELNFNLVGPDLDGDVRVLISSRDPLNEPFLELLLVLRWPGGSLRREYVLLFDPPEAPVPVVSPVVETPTATLVRTVPQLPPAEEPAAPAAVVEVPEPVAVEEAPVSAEPVATAPAVVIVSTPEPVVPEPEPELVAPAPEPEPALVPEPPRARRCHC